MFIKRMSKINWKGHEALVEFRNSQQSRTDQLISILHDLLTKLQQDGTPENQIAAMRNVVGNQTDEIIEDCQVHAEYAGEQLFGFALAVL